MLLLLPVVVGASADLVRDGHRLVTSVSAGRAMLMIYLSYAVVVLLALAAYAVLGWRRRFLAFALILGPFTFARPVVAFAGAAAAAWRGHDGFVAVLALGAATAVLAVEPLADRRWYSRRAATGGS